MIAKTGCEIVGVEHDRKGFEVARSCYPNIHFYNFGVQNDPQLLVSREGLFDVVVSTEVIEHLFSPHLLPLYAKHVLRDKGYLIISTPYHGYLKNLVLSICNKWDIHHTSLWHGGHIKFWSKKTLKQLLKENGFETTVYFCGVGRVPYLWKSMILVAQKTSASAAIQWHS
jgi:2-polyprenyl-3-methyl-5-hydroxy-6-metoxy-1,4-benzoquinol methylase